jgi:DNA-binding NtrC family response regulator
MNVPWQIMIASADVEERRAMVNILVKQGLDPIIAASVSECRESMEQENVGLLLAARVDGSRTRIVLTTRLTDWDEYLDAVRLGAFDVISAPCRPTDMEWMIIQALRDEHARARQITFAQRAANALRQSNVCKSA